MVLNNGIGDEADVLIVGGGPTGMTLANLLGHRGVDVMLVERESGTSDEPRAVSFDDESLRILQSCELDGEAYELILQGTGTKYFGMDGRALGYARGPRLPPLGHPVKNPFSQPELERMLLDGARRFANVDVRHRAELTALEIDRGGTALATVRAAGGEPRAVAARFVIGCDGGRSTVRTSLGIAMRGSSFSEPWLVVDTLEDDHDERYAMHHGDPRRPFVIVPGRDGRCRYEFMVLPGEDPDRITRLDEVRSLVAPWRELTATQVERCTVYTFHALAAERWRQGPALLAGDAAHMMPPFAGQGLNSGFRDAANLAWKLAAVVRGEADAGLLDTYEAERRPHAEAITRLSVRLGRVMMTRHVAVARVRDQLIRVASQLPPVHRYIAENRFKPAARYAPPGAILPAAAGAGRADEEIVGRMLPQPDVLRADGTRARLDDVLGSGFALLAVSPPSTGPCRPTGPVWEALAPRRVALTLDDRAPRDRWAGVVSIADIDGGLGQRLDAYRGRVLLIRPDRFVAAVLSADLHGVDGPLLAALHLRLRPPAPPEPGDLPVSVSETRLTRP
jgi:3-(3-hydroxy-phenyl)propionate hydroxylase